MNNNYILGSHNSWSYLPPKHWWMCPFSFMARCQRVSIREQYKLGVRCFDLRILFDDDEVCVAHGLMVYRIGFVTLLEHLRWINDFGDCYVRIFHEARRKSQYTPNNVDNFRKLCRDLTTTFPNIHFWGGRNLYNWHVDYDFTTPYSPEPSCCEQYASVCRPRLIDDWFPWLFARFHNHDILTAGTEKEVLLIDFVDIR